MKDRLLELIDGSINGRADNPAPVMATPADTIVDSFVYNRVADFAAAQTGSARTRADALLEHRDGRRLLRDSSQRIVEEALHQPDTGLRKGQLDQYIALGKGRNLNVPASSRSALREDSD